MPDLRSTFMPDLRSRIRDRQNPWERQDAEENGGDDEPELATSAVTVSGILEPVSHVENFFGMVRLDCMQILLRYL
jgi:hypothetical protein